MASVVTPEASAVLSNTSTRTLILGIDKAGRIRQHDRGAGDVLSLEPGALIGTELGTLLAAPDGPQATTLQTLIDGVGSDREGTAVLAVQTANGQTAEAVVTIQPIRSADPELAAQVIMRIAPPVHERFLDPAIMRHTMVDGAVRRIGGALDIDQVAPELINIIVPHFCNAAGLIVLESLVNGRDDFPSGPMDGTQLVRRLAVAHDDDDAFWDAAFPTGELLRYPPDTPYTKCMDSCQPVCEQISPDGADEIAAAWTRQPVADLLSGVSLLLLPIIARDLMLGFFVCVRRVGYRRFDPYDIEIGMDFASRAAIFLDNAQRYNREHTTALTLQRSMLPTGLSHPSSVDVRHRYLPGTKQIEIGGDWYESIEMPGGRVALVVGDVAGHGVQAAATMGRLRTAILTLAKMEVPPAETLQHLNELMREIAEVEWAFATCVYAIFDAVTGSCEVALAGHPPPLLVRPDGTSAFLDLEPAPPLGVDNGPIQTRQLQIEDGSLLVLYSDGLVEKRGQDIDVGLGILRDIYGPATVGDPVDDLCKATLAGVYADQQRDDIALLVARLRRIPSDRVISWTLAAELTSAGKARSVIRRPLRRWGLAELIPTAELLVSELVTNAVRYAQGKIVLRLVKERTLFIEVLDDSAALPRLRHPDDSDERGRGLQVVSQFAQRWGARRAVSGKVVWCELQLPPCDGEPER